MQRQLKLLNHIYTSHKAIKHCIYVRKLFVCMPKELIIDILTIAKLISHADEIVFRDRQPCAEIGAVCLQFHSRRMIDVLE
jgi:hypothetical protein